MARAVWALSPVSMTVLMPSACSSAMAWRLLSLTVSATANSHARSVVGQQDDRLALLFQRRQLRFQFV
jgi:hypothetical protein